jgi:beta-glucosidase/6-phospho-beta-glucosidase/beta-galactosidase
LGPFSPQPQVGHAAVENHGVAARSYNRSRFARGEARPAFEQIELMASRGGEDVQARSIRAAMRLLSFTGLFMTPGFLFATGIEGSVPTIAGGRVRMDEFEKCGHYLHWETDFALVKQMGIDFLRYGPPLHRTFLGPDRYDWEFSDLAFGRLHELRIVPIVDLCHFGVPDWIGDFQNPDFPELFAQYARAFAQRYPWVQLYTPVNEMYVCALFSGSYGWWNEQLSTDQGFVTALKHLVKANLLGMWAILDERPDALFIQSEASGYFHAENPKAIGPAEVMNARRFLSLDLNYGRRIDSEMYEYLMDNGMKREEYHFFLDNHLKHHCIMGNDYYLTNEHRVADDGSTAASGEIFGYSVITTMYYERYRLPVMHTETNLCEGPTGREAVHWLWKEWANVLRVRNNGVPILGFTWYSLTDQVDWDTALRENNGNVNPLGLYDLDRKIRPVGSAYKKLIADWRSELPTQSVCLKVPIVMPPGSEREPGPAAPPPVSGHTTENTAAPANT